MKKKIISVFFAIILIFALKNYSNAANASIQCGETAVINKPFTISVTGSGVQWNLSLQVNGQTIVSNNELDNVEGNKSISFSGNYTPTNTGTLTITLVGSVTEASDGSTIKSFATKTVTVSNSTSTNNGNSSGTNNSGQNSNSNVTTPSKSNVATLSNLGITPNDFSGFKAGKYEYSTEVPNDVETVEIYAKKGQSGQTISGTGKKTLKEGANTFNIIVTAEDGKTKKTYTLTINRKAKETNSTQNETTNEIADNTTVDEPEETEDPTKIGFGLTKLEISGFEIQPQFQTDVFDYKIDLKENLEKLEIEAIATQENANIEINGNENLQEGENIITILVNSEDGQESVAYQIIVNKSIEEQDEIQGTVDNDKIKKIAILSGAVGIIAIIVIVVVIKKVRNSKNDSFIPYENVFDKDEEDINTFESFDYSEKDIQEDLESNTLNSTKESRAKDRVLDMLNSYDDEKIKNKKRSKGKRFK